MDLWRLVLLVVEYVGSATASPLSNRQTSSTVALDYATYEGIVGSNGITNYLSMRYALPPVGNLRWKAPQDPAMETGVQSATTVSLHTHIHQWLFLAAEAQHAVSTSVHRRRTKCRSGRWHTRRECRGRRLPSH